MTKLSDKAGTLTFVPDPQSPDSAGFVTVSADDTVPAGWLECNGQAVSRTEYAELFALIGTTYGAGDGSTTFNLPGGDLLNNAEVTGDLIVDTDTLVVDSANDRVGIGTGSPDFELSVFDSTNPVIGLKNSASASNGSTIQLFEDDMYVWNYEAAGKLLLGTNGQTQMTIDETGTTSLLNSLAIGKNTASYKLDVLQDAADTFAAKIEQNSTGGFGLLIDGASTTANDPLLRVKNGAGLDVLNVDADGAIEASGNVEASTFSVTGGTPVYAGSRGATTTGTLSLSTNYDLDLSPSGKSLDLVDFSVQIRVDNNNGTPINTNVALQILDSNDNSVLHTSAGNNINLPSGFDNILVFRTSAILRQPVGNYRCRYIITTPGGGAVGYYYGIRTVNVCAIHLG